MCTYATKIVIPTQAIEGLGDDHFYAIDKKHRVEVVHVSQTVKCSILDEAGRYLAEYHHRHYVDAYDVDEDEHRTEDIKCASIVVRNDMFYGIIVKDGQQVFVIDKSGSYRYVFHHNSMTSDREEIHYARWRLIKRPT